MKNRISAHVVKTIYVYIRDSSFNVLIDRHIRKKKEKKIPALHRQRSSVIKPVSHNSQKKKIAHMPEYKRTQQ